VNPLGIQEDSRYAAGSEDRSFDLVWYSAGQIGEQGYTIEVQIPLKSIRYANTNPVTMGVIFERRYPRPNTVLRLTTARQVCRPRSRPVLA
jgi:hypothetical protein